MIDRLTLAFVRGLGIAERETVGTVVAKPNRYIAVLIAGARPELVRGTILQDGAGLAGGGQQPGPIVVRGVPGRTTAPDPFALVELGSDIRPPEYVARFAELAAENSGLATPIFVCCKSRPDWLKAVLATKGAVETTLEIALAECVRR